MKQNWFFGVLFLIACFAVFGVVDMANAQSLSGGGRSYGIEGLGSFAQLAETVAPAVVNIDVEATNPRDQRQMKGQGSGFIIGPDGYIVTNQHVIRSADQIKIRLIDRREFDAQVIGSDQKTDLALLKIEATNLPYLSFGDSNNLRVGDWVIAIGNPFGLAHTVTAGIVSAKGRVLGAGPYDDYIQTDASINPGNSGGPLINVRGEVVGINTLINAAAQGIGFAIPSNLAKVIIEQLRMVGRVERSWLGAYFESVTSQTAASLGLDRPQGGLVNQIIPGSPAEEGGLQNGDVVIEYNGRQVRDADELPNMIASTRVGQRVSLRVIRNRRPVVLNIQLGSMPDDSTRLAPRTSTTPPGPRTFAPGDMGLQLAEITPDVARRMGIVAGSGVLVQSVNANSQAQRAGLIPGDVILSLNKKPVRNVNEFVQVLNQLPEGSRIVLNVRRGNRNMLIPMAR